MRAKWWWQRPLMSKRTDHGQGKELEASSHHPTDTSLLWDTVPVLNAD